MKWNIKDIFDVSFHSLVNPSMCYIKNNVHVVYVRRKPKHVLIKRPGSWPFIQTRKHDEIPVPEAHVNTGTRTGQRSVSKWQCKLNMQGPKEENPTRFYWSLSTSSSSTFLHRMLLLPSQKACLLRDFLAYLYDFCFALFYFGIRHPFNVQNHAWEECKLRTATTPTCRVFNVPPRKMPDTSSYQFLRRCQSITWWSSERYSDFQLFGGRCRCLHALGYDEVDQFYI